MRTVDEIALEAAQRILKIDPDTLIGGEAQATAAIQVAVTDAIREARSLERHLETDKPC